MTQPTSILKQKKVDERMKNENRGSQLIILVLIFFLISVLCYFKLNGNYILRYSCLNVSYTNGETWTNNDCYFDVLQDCNKQCDRLFPYAYSDFSNSTQFYGLISSNNYCRYECSKYFPPREIE